MRIQVISPAGDVCLVRDFPDSKTISIGRSSESDIPLVDFGSTISRCHAVIQFDGSNWKYFNLGANGSFRNGRKIKSFILETEIAIRLGKRGPILQLRPEDTKAKSGDLSDSDSDISGWIQRVCAGDEKAAQLLWDRYADDIVAVARKSMNDQSRRVEDEEDVALIAFRSFLAGLTAGRFPGLDRREQLWQLLLVITSRKAAAAVEKASRQKRGSGLVRGDSALMDREDDVLDGFDCLESQQPPHDFAIAVADETQRLLASLDPVSQRIAALKMEGRTHQEAAEVLGLNIRSIERRLKAIREQWEKLITDG